MRSVVIIGIMMLLIVGSAVALTYEYPVVEEGRHYTYCSQLSPQVQIRLETVGDTWTTTKAVNSHSC